MTNMGMDRSELYLPPDVSGVAWLLNADHPELANFAKTALERKPDDACAPRAVASDLEMFAHLLAERHFGIANGIVAATGAVGLVHEAVLRVRRERPTTWGVALAGRLDPLRLALNDHHVQMTGAPQTRLRAGEPRFTPPPAEPAVSIARHGDVCWIRISRLHGSDADLTALERWVRDAPDHFDATRIVIDLRGNMGGDDTYVYRWATQGAPGGRAIPEWSREWTIKGHVANIWNSSAIRASLEGAGNRGAISLSGFSPAPGDTLALVTPNPLVPAPGPHAWHGKMLVLTDPATTSSGESAAWMLKHLFEARLVGAPSRGMIEYGNLAPYLLPASGLFVMLPTKHNDYHLPVELRGFPVDVAVAPDNIGPELLAHLW